MPVGRASYRGVVNSKIRMRIVSGVLVLMFAVVAIASVVGR